MKISDLRGIADYDALEKGTRLIELLEERAKKMEQDGQFKIYWIDVVDFGKLLEDAFEDEMLHLEITGSFSFCALHMSFMVGPNVFVNIPIKPGQKNPYQCGGE